MPHLGSRGLGDSFSLKRDSGQHQSGSVVTIVAGVVLDILVRYGILY
jgi:hypothetical protein